MQNIADIACAVFPIGEFQTDTTDDAASFASVSCPLCHDRKIEAGTWPFLLIVQKAADCLFALHQGFGPQTRNRVTSSREE